jgi:unsaturated chondroitin disaccharide hydrolase
MKVQERLAPADFRRRLKTFWDLSGRKIHAIERGHDPSQGAPVFTVRGRYTSRGWTEWTQGFLYGSEILQFDATGDPVFLEAGRRHTVEHMAPHLTHMGVHDHGFNNVSTYGNLLRLMREGKIPCLAWEEQFYELALKCSGAVQARRWISIAGGDGYIYSFNGPHSLFADTIRSLRSLALAWRLGQVLMEENDRRVSLLERLVKHARTTARFNVYYGQARDAYDVRGRVAHESLFNVNDGEYRCPSSQQGFSPFSTWMRGLAWILCGYAEQLEFLAGVPRGELDPLGGWPSVEALCLDAAGAAADFYIENTAADGIPYWDTGAPGLYRLGDYRRKPSDPFNPHEPVDSSAAAISAPGVVRLGRYMGRRKPGSGARAAQARRYRAAGLTVLDTLLGEPYLSTRPAHQGLLLHSVYHRPRGWDHVPRGRLVPCGESSMWGDYHMRELALLVQREADHEPWLTFFGGKGVGDERRGPEQD